MRMREARRNSVLRTMKIMPEAPRRYSVLNNGNLQMLSIHVPGDIPDLQGLHLRIMDHTLASIGRSKIAVISHHDILEVVRKSPRPANLFWRESLVDAAVARSIARRYFKPADGIIQV